MRVSRSIPALKAPADVIIDLIGIVHRLAGNRKAMDDAIVEHLADVSSASKRNLVRAYAVPSLSHLGLVEGRGESLRCSSDGESLVHAAQQGFDGALRRFGYLLHALDSNNGLQVLSELCEMRASEKPVSRATLVNRLWRKYGTDLTQQGLSLDMLADRLAKWLAYLQYVRFVDLADATVILRPAQIEASAAAGRVDVPQELFRRLLVGTYGELKRRAMGSAYVALPDVRHHVIAHLLKRGMPITEAQFDDLLRGLPKLTEGYVILLSPPGRTSEGGIWVDKDYYYYVSIYPSKGEGDD